MLMLGCNGDEDNSPSDFIVLVDETASFDELWKESIDEIAKYIIGGMDMGEGFCLISIDNESFDEHDVRVPAQILPEDIKFRMESARLKKQVLGFKDARRPSDLPGAGISGALAYAHHLSRSFSQKSRPEHRLIVVLFSDLAHSTWNQSALKDIRFKEGSEIYCFNVRAEDKEKWDSIVAYWTNAFRVIGFPKTGRDNFWTIKETPRQLKLLFR